MSKKIIIIGGGVSGITSGVYAQKAGFDAEIYEKHTIMGGECTGWDRKGYHIDNCIHWLMGSVYGSTLNRIWHDTDAINDNVKVISNDFMYRSELNGQSITLWKDIDRTEKEMIELSPEDEKEIKDLMHYAKLCESIEIPADKPTELMGAIDVLKLMGATKSVLKVYKRYDGMDTLDLMNRFKHPLIRCMISDFCPKESLASSFPMAYGNYVGGDGGVIQGGSRALALRMQKKFEDLGGICHTNSPVEKIELEGDKAVAIILKDGTKVAADYIVCACDTDYTFNHLLDKSYMDETLKYMYENEKAYPIYGMFQIAFAVDSPDDVLKGDIMLDSTPIKTYSWISDRISVKTYAYDNFAPEGKQIMQVMLGLDSSAYDFWMNLYTNDKDKYNEEKKSLAEKLQSLLEERFTEYNGKLSILDIWTPVTYKRYCNAYRGYNQAFTMTKYSLKNKYPSPYVHGIDNVIISGQWITPPGGLPGAAIQGKFAIQRILKKEGRKINL